MHDLRVKSRHYGARQRQGYRPGRSPPKGDGDDVEAAHYRRPDDGGLATDEQRIADEPRQRQPGRGAPADRPGEGSNQQPGDQGHVLPGNRHQMRCTRRVHVIGQIGRETGTLAQQHAGGQRGLRLGKRGRQRVRQRAPDIDERGAQVATLAVGDDSHVRIGD